MTHSRQVNAINSFHDGGRYHIETSPLICGAGFYMTTASAMKELTRTNPHILPKIRFGALWSYFLV